MADNMQKTISLDSDLMGSISAHLRDLSGFATLAAELTQNADDAGNATEIRFDACDDALLVSNDGTFSSCGDPTGRQCSDPIRCDLHSFRRFAGQSKRRKEDTTGAFGIGFTVAYQVSDEPELISSGQHWTLRPQVEDPRERIAICEGCRSCSDHSGTTFRLPWASEHSVTREALGVDPVSVSDQGRFLEEVGSAVGDLTLFLKRVSRIVVARHGTPVKEVTVKRNGSIKIHSGRSVTEFLALGGDFESEAIDLKGQHGSIEPKRSGRVTVAVPKTGLLKGRPYATLPTNQYTALNFHFNADFFPESDRKGIHLEDGYQAKWNFAALQACGTALAAGLPRLREELSPDQLWRVIASTQLAPSKTSEVGFSEALEPIAEVTAQAVKQSDVVPLTSGGWSRPEQAWVLEVHDEELVALLEELEVPVAAPLVLEALTGVDPGCLGLEFLDLQALCRLLVDIGLDKTTAEGAIPAPLQAKGRLRAVWTEIERLLKNGRGAPDDLSGVAVFPDSAGSLHTSEGVVTADRETIELFSPWIPFLSAQRLKGCAELRDVVDDYSVESVVDALDGRSLKNQPEIVDWLAARAADIHDAVLEADVGELKIFRGSDGADHLLSELLLPTGDFEDPIGIARLFSKATVARHRDFLADLGAAVLTLESYLDDVLPKALRDTGEDTVPEWIDPLLSMLTEQLPSSDASAVRSLIGELPIIPTSRGLKPPDRAYLPSRWVISVLGETAPIVDPDVSRRHGSLFRQLGIPDEPRPDQVMARVEKLIAETPEPPAAKMIGEVLRFLTAKFEEGSHSGTGRQNEDFEKNYADLRDLEWLPASGDRKEWHKPSDVIRASQKHLVGSRMPILLEPKEPGKTALLYRLLGIPGQPAVGVVVANLRDLSEGLESPHPEIYGFLDRHHEEDQVAALATERCFLIGGRWMRPDQIFRGGNSLAPLRATLPEEFRRYPDLLAALNVYDEPQPQDGLAVLLEIAQEHSGTYPSRAEELEAPLWEAWRLIEIGFDSGALTTSAVRLKLESKPVVPHQNDDLGAPRRTFVADLPGVEAGFPPEVRNAVIEPTRGTASALRAAGVRGLYSASETETRGGSGGPETDEYLASRLGEMREPILRVAEYALSGTAAETAAERLDDLKVKPQADLESRLSLRYGDFSIGHTEWKPSDVAYVRRLHTLFRSDDAIHPDGVKLARQLALALAEEATEAVETIALLAHVVDCHDEKDAHSRLDELAIPRFAVRPCAKLELSQPSAEAFEVSGEPNGDSGPSNSPHEMAEAKPEPTRGQSEPDADDEQTPRNTTLANVGAKLPTRPDPEVAAGVLGAAAASSDEGPRRQPNPGPPRKGAQTSPSEQWAMIVSYPASEGDDDDHEPEAGAAEAKSAVEQVGVRISMQHELDCGRVPEEMPVNNPGYDIESRDSSGEIVRYIEVKAISGSWGTHGFPKLTPTQIEKARKLEERFWLYVIENANSNCPSMAIRIQNPYRTATRFIFDAGWRTLAESP